jgi:hypothetical protein
MLILFAAVIAAATDVHTAAIKETARLTVSRFGLAQAIEITDPAVLALSNVFAGTFIGEPATEPDAEWPRYAVAFDIQARDGIKVSAYVVAYCVNRWTGEGFVYLPGARDAVYRRNIATILRSGQEGRWHRASDPWSAALHPYLR